MAIRREHAGGAAQADLQASINAAALSFQVQSGQGAGYPTGATGPFVIAIGRGSSSEEKLLVASRSGDVFTVTSRGYDNTLAVDHNVPSTVDHVLGAIEIDEANAHLMAATAVHGITGAVVGTTDTQSLTNKTIPAGTNTITGITPAMMSLGANWAAALAASLDTDVATVLGAMHSSWVTPLNTALDADAASLLANIANSWVTVLQTALGTNWATALSTTLDTDSRTVLAAMGTGWPAILGAAPGSNWAAALAATLDTDTATVLGAMGTGWPAVLAAVPAAFKPVVHTRDGSFPVAGSVTTEEDVLDRYTVASVTWARRFALNASVFTSNTQTASHELLWYAGSTVIGRSQEDATATRGAQMPCLATHDLAASTAVVFELRLARVSGTGIASSSGGNYTQTTVVSCPV